MSAKKLLFSKMETRSFSVSEQIIEVCAGDIRVFMDLHF